MIEVEGLHFSRSDGGVKKTAILQNLNLSVASGVNLALLGDSGSGKTTLLHILAGLLSPERGSVVIKRSAIKPV